MDYVPVECARVGSNGDTFPSADLPSSSLKISPDHPLIDEDVSIEEIVTPEAFFIKLSLV